MQYKSQQASRRRFLRQFSYALTAMAGAYALPSGRVFAAETSVADELLALRKDASPLALHFNENPLGMPTRAVEAAYYAANRFGHRYPDDAVRQFTAMLAKANTVTEEQLVLGNGSTEVLGAVVAYAKSINATIIEPTPTFGDVRNRAKTLGVKVVQVETDEDFQTDLDALKKKADSVAGPVVINLCNPNNPTGTIVESNALKEWIMNAADSCTFLIDEAYYEYALQTPGYHSVLPLILEGKENLILTRTFSKIYGMAGMRIGYGIAAPRTAQLLNQFATSYNLSITGIAAAMAALDDTTFYQSSIQSNNQGKQILTAALDELNLRYIPSHTNFVLHKINSDIVSYQRRMQVNAIKVGRRMTAQDGWNRVTIGTPDQMQAFVATLKAFREKGWV